MFTTMSLGHVKETLDLVVAKTDVDKLNVKQKRLVFHGMPLMWVEIMATTKFYLYIGNAPKPSIRGSI